MAKIFYLGGGTHARGILRAVVTIDQLESLLAPELVTHIGHEFPEVSDALTLVEIPSDEGTAIWPAGYSRVEATSTDFDERLRFLPEPITSLETNNASTAQRFRFDPLANASYAFWRLNANSAENNCGGCSG